jgi:Immunity protein 50
MSETASLIEHSEKLTTLFGCWPSFHDAEVSELHHWRGRVKPGDWDDSNIFPIFTVKLRILQATQKAHTTASPDILATLRFHDVNDFTMSGFNHINQIVELSVTVQERGTFSNGERLPPYLVVSLERGFGISASFRCFRIEVLEAVPYKNDREGEC